MPQVELDAGTIHYEDTGGEGPALVFLHGLVMDHTMWRSVLPALSADHRCVLPTLPLGAHRTPMRPGADLGIWGMVNLVADFLQAVDLRDVTLVCSDWGGGLLLTHIGRDGRVGRMVICACEAFDNFPPGLPGRMAAIAARLPGGVALALRQLRIGALRRSPLLLGWMTRRGIPDEIARGWTAPGLASAGVRADLRSYARSPLDRAELVRATEALARFGGPALILWGREDRVMPPGHASRLAALMPDARLVLLEDAYTLLSEDRPGAVAAEMRAFMAETAAVSRRSEHVPGR